MFHTAPTYITENYMKEICESCGNEYENCFRISLNGQEYFFDSFEYAINKMAPVFGHCKTKVIGHGVENSGEKFCCNHCANHATSL